MPSRIGSNKPLPSTPPAVPAKPAAASAKPTAASNTVAVTSAKPLPAPGPQEGGIKHSLLDKSNGEAPQISGGDAKFKAPQGALQNVLVDKQVAAKEVDVFGGKAKTQLGSAQVSTTHHSGPGEHLHSVQAELSGPSASFEAQKEHVGRLGTSSAQVSAEAHLLKAQAQAGVHADTQTHAYTAAVTAKAETGVGVKASVSHDINEHVGAYATGEAKASAAAVLEGTASFDPKNGTALLEGKVGAGATAGAYGTVGGHLGRLSASLKAGAVAGAAASAGGSVGMDKGKFKLASDVNAAVGVGTHVTAEVALDTSHHAKPDIKQGLVNMGLVGIAPGLPAAAKEGPLTEPRKSALGALMGAGLVGAGPGMPSVSKQK